MVKLLQTLLLCSLIPNSAFAIRFEEQRKYNFTTKKMFPLAPFSIAEFDFYPHSVYVNGDIYFDTEEQLLQNAQLSLRLRRVKKGNADFLYAVQLKSEMESVTNSMRIEEEYKEIQNQSIDGIPIIKVIDTILDNPVTAQSQKTLDLAARWMARKENSSLSPFQMLRRRGLGAKSLKPLLIGRANRSRYHVYFDKTARVSRLLELSNSEKNLALTPAF
ncbi:MAG: CYTH domain-containing protein, partial [Bdellovibrionales bacterium]|nr:CYTH domain-containing protein [Bdellovibrionales bacterium]